MVNISTFIDKGDDDFTCAISIIPVRVKLNNKSQRRMLSSTSFCSEKLARHLRANGKKTQITFNTVGNTQTLNTYAIIGLQVSICQWNT